MKQLFIVLAALICFATTSEAQVKPSDTTALPYSVPVIMDVIEDAVESPTDTNAYVLNTIPLNTVLTFTVGQPLTNDKKSLIQNWVKANPEEIEKLLIARKRNHDNFSQ